MMRDFSEEHSVLLELGARIAERPVLVTFNGRTFDWPLLESRYLMTRCYEYGTCCASGLAAPARAVWSCGRIGATGGTGAACLDSPRLDGARNDVPSSMIPQFYFDYLRDDRHCRWHGWCGTRNGFCAGWRV